MPRSTSVKTGADEPRPKRTRRVVRRRRAAAPEPVTHEQIALRAYELHLRGEGADATENWLKAERELVAA